MGELLRPVCTEQVLLDAWDQVLESVYQNDDPGAEAVAFEEPTVANFAEVVQSSVNQGGS